MKLELCEPQLNAIINQRAINPMKSPFSYGFSMIFPMGEPTYRYLPYIVSAFSICWAPQSGALWSPGRDSSQHTCRTRRTPSADADAEWLEVTGRGSPYEWGNHRKMGNHTTKYYIDNHKI